MATQGKATLPHSLAAQCVTKLRPMNRKRHHAVAPRTVPNGNEAASLTSFLLGPLSTLVSGSWLDVMAGVVAPPWTRGAMPHNELEEAGVPAVPHSTRRPSSGLIHDREMKFYLV